MKKLVNAVCFVLLIVMVLSTVSCMPYRGPYTFWRQDRENIVKIEVCSYDYKTEKRGVILELPKEDTDKIIDEISSFNCHSVIGDHPREYSPVMICVTYSDGEIELISFDNIGYITPQGKQHLTHYAINGNFGKNFYKLLCRYVDPGLLPEDISEYLEFYKNLPDTN